MKQTFFDKSILHTFEITTPAKKQPFGTVRAHTHEEAIRLAEKRWGKQPYGLYARQLD